MKKIFITGGAGFIGTNAAKYFSKKKWQVYVFDNLSRKGTTYNIRWLKKNTNIIFIKGDIRNFNNLSKTRSYSSLCRSSCCYNFFHKSKRRF